MTAIDHWAAISAAIACLFLGLRAEVLKPGVAKFHTAPTPVVLALAILSIAMAAAVISIWWGEGHATLREAWVYTGIAVSAVILFWNVHRQRAVAPPPTPASRAAWPPADRHRAAGA